jgi:hypothetical protein
MWKQKKNISIGSEIEPLNDPEHFNLQRNLQLCRSRKNVSNGSEIEPLNDPVQRARVQRSKTTKNIEIDLRINIYSEVLTFRTITMSPADKLSSNSLSALKESRACIGENKKSYSRSTQDINSIL